MLGAIVGCLLGVDENLAVPGVGLAVAVGTEDSNATWLALVLFWQLAVSEALVWYGDSPSQS